MPVLPKNRLRFTVAVGSYRRRVLADAIDFSLLCGVAYFAFRTGLIRERVELQPAAEGSSTPPDLIDRVADFVATDLTLLLPGLVLVSIAGVAYGLVAHVFFDRTVGEFSLGLRLITDTGERVGPFRALLRGLFTGVGALALGLGHTYALVDRDRRTLADLAVGTLLIRGRPTPAETDPNAGTQADLPTLRG